MPQLERHAETTAQAAKEGGMRLAAVMMWFEEDPAELDEAVSSLAGLADEMVAVDGAFAQFPRARAHSSIEEAAAIAEAAARNGLASTVHCPSRPWRGEVEKRNAMLALATPRCDYFMWLDADERVICQDPERVRAQIETMEAPIGTVEFHTVAHGPRDPTLSTWEEPGVSKRVRRVWRVVEGMRIATRHWFMSGIVDGERRALWGNDPAYPREERKQPLDFRIDHHALARSPDRRDRKHVYYQARNQAAGDEP
jgi:hypothetical protein